MCILHTLSIRYGRRPINDCFRLPCTARFHEEYYQTITASCKLGMIFLLSSAPGHFEQEMPLHVPMLADRPFLFVILKVCIFFFVLYVAVNDCGINTFAYCVISSLRVFLRVKQFRRQLVDQDYRTHDTTYKTYTTMPVLSTSTSSFIT